jgi:hypothetical protein
MKSMRAMELGVEDKALSGCEVLQHQKLVNGGCLSVEPAVADHQLHS